MGDVALMILAIFWAVLVMFLALVMVNLFRVLEATKGLLDGIRTETVPLLAEVKVTVAGVNKEMERVDGVMSSVGNIAKSAERVSAVVEHTVSSPLIKLVAFGAGASRAVKRLRGGS